MICDIFVLWLKLTYPSYCHWREAVCLPWVALKFYISIKYLFQNKHFSDLFNERTGETTNSFSVSSKSLLQWISWSSLFSCPPLSPFWLQNSISLKLKEVCICTSEWSTRIHWSRSLEILHSYWWNFTMLAPRVMP